MAIHSSYGDWLSPSRYRSSLSVVVREVCPICMGFPALVEWASDVGGGRSHRLERSWDVYPLILFIMPFLPTPYAILKGL